MTREEAKTFLCSIAGDLGFVDIENYTCNDGEKMREAIKALEERKETVTEFADRCRECGREKVLDKISKELKGFSKYYLETEKVLEIIDEYREGIEEFIRSEEV